MRIKGHDIYGLQDNSFKGEGLRTGREKEQNNPRQQQETLSRVTSKPALDNAGIKSFQKSLDSSTNLISNTEKQYFKELFPDSQQQIDSHIVFNRQGSILANNVKKGVILDTVV